MLNFGIMGTGRMAVRLADLAAKGGHKVTLGSRDPHRAVQIAEQLGGTVTGGSYHDAAACNIVMPSIFIRDGAFEQLHPFADAIAGKIVVDILNPFNDAYDDFILPWDTSAAEELQKIWPEARIVSTFKWPFWEAFENSDFDGGPMDIIHTGDDQLAKDVVLQGIAMALSRWRRPDTGAFYRTHDALLWSAWRTLRHAATGGMAAAWRALDGRTARCVQQNHQSVG